MRNKFSLSFFYVLIAIFTFFTFSCSKKVNSVSSDFSEIKSSTHKWYYFSQNEFLQIEKPQKAPFIPAKPYTESVRISSASSQMQNQENEYSAPKGFALVNRVGMLIFDNEKIDFVKDATFFTDKTASNLVFYNETPVFSVYKSSFFNNSERKNTENLNPFLVQLNLNQKVFFPILNVENLGLDSNCEITDFVWDGQYWTCSVKKTDASKTDFSFLTFQVKKDLLLLSPTSAQKELFIQQTDSQAFRTSRKIESYKHSPQRIQEILKSVQKKDELFLKVYTAGSHSPRYFSNQKNQNENKLNATCLLSDIFSAVLFEDGSFYINGALYEKNIFNQGKTCAMKFPKLPAGYVYSDFAITGTYLYAAWEESAFFKTGKSGFIQIDLNKVLANF